MPKSTNNRSKGKTMTAKAMKKTKGGLQVGASSAFDRGIIPATSLGQQSEPATAQPEAAAVQSSATRRIGRIE
jgi:hypothetical protein